MLEHKDEDKKAHIEHASGTTNHEINREALLFVVGLFSLFLVIFILFGPTKTKNYEVEVSYNDIEHYTEKEPYQTQEAYQVQEPYETTETYVDKVPVEQSVPYADYELISQDAPAGKYYSSCGDNAYCTKYNTDLLTDIFGGAKCIQCTKKVPVTKYKTEIIYQDIEKERPVTKYKTVTKYRTVTQYRDVDKTRDIVKTKMEPREMEVNWIWSFKMPYKLHVPVLSK